MHSYAYKLTNFVKRSYYNAMDDEDSLTVNHTTAPMNGTASRNRDATDARSKKNVRCPTCHGIGWVRKEEEGQLVALIPLNDQRLKPRRTIIYVLLAVGLCAVIGFLCGFFLYPRDVKLYSKESMALLQPDAVMFGNGTVDFIITTSVNLINDNYYSTPVKSISVSVMMNKKELAKTNWHSSGADHPEALARSTVHLPLNVSFHLNTSDEPELVLEMVCMCLTVVCKLADFSLENVCMMCPTVVCKLADFNLEIVCMMCPTVVCKLADFSLEIVCMMCPTVVCKLADFSLEIVCMMCPTVVCKLADFNLEIVCMMCPTVVCKLADFNLEIVCMMCPTVVCKLADFNLEIVCMMCPTVVCKLADFNLEIVCMMCPTVVCKLADFNLEIVCMMCPTVVCKLADFNLEIVCMMCPTVVCKLADFNLEIVCMMCPTVVCKLADFSLENVCIMSYCRV
ncbi:hypothetical protein RRG08_041561 [Elysia crispata]|uniref:Transmembrane protein 106 N-terminal domain-containing protein n=1 Tax=Elysia crispata TaxID=231223 RepID=A0AAE0ZUK6_9GAST|nr:hypothetical protein RRG08_041561 [Elysia crispata]